MDGKVLKDIALTLMKRASDMGLHVMAFASDMGSANQAMWKSFGIGANAKKNVNSIPHPIKEGAKLYFLADVPHLLKNIKQALIKGHQFTLPEETCREQALLSLSASVEPVKDLAQFQVSVFILYMLIFMATGSTEN
jgi:hypothetical protein